LQERIAEVPRDRRIAVHCAGGYRSSIAASILHHYGIKNLIEMASGLAAWDAAKLPVIRKLSRRRKTTFPTPGINSALLCQ
jgi:rhodanese-related sulfurtransferase